MESVLEYLTFFKQYLLLYCTIQKKKRSSLVSQKTVWRTTETILQRDKIENNLKKSNCHPQLSSIHLIMTEGTSKTESVSSQAPVLCYNTEEREETRGKTVNHTSCKKGES